MRKSPYRCDPAGAFAVNVALTLQQNPPVAPLREHQGIMNDYATVIQIDGVEERFDIVGMESDASMLPVNADDQETEPELQL